MGSRVASATAACLALWCACVSVCGSPVPTKDILAAVHTLAANCADNLLLSDNRNITSCEGTLKMKTSLQCLSFLDVNTRLCALKNFAGFNLTERLRVEASKPLNVATLCAAPGAFTFGSLPDYPVYEAKISKIVANQAHCLQLCASEDLSEEPNYFCKVLHWGSNIIKNVSSAIDQAGTKDTARQQLEPAGAAMPVVHGNVEHTPLIKPKIDENSAGAEKVEISAIKNTEINSNSVASNTNSIGSNIASEPTHVLSDINQIDANPNAVKTEVSKPVIPVHSDATDPKSTEGKPQNPEKSNVLDIPHTEEEVKLTETSEVKPPTSQHVASGNSVQQEGEGFLEDNMGNAEQTPKLVTPGSTNKPGLGEPADKPEASDNGFDYGGQDQDEDREDNPETVNNVVKNNQLPQPERDSYEKQFNSISPPDDFLDDDDGHFFPMFFSGVVLMVLLYVLYHNKNKVMGLIVEGRQPGGRRRTSRGHAYRRLDTLEQAISSSAPGATPSKIIY